MSDRVVICYADDDLDPNWERLGVWEDGEWVEGEFKLEKPLGGELTADEIFERVDGPRVYAFKPENAPA